MRDTLHDVFMSKSDQKKVKSERKVSPAVNEHELVTNRDKIKIHLSEELFRSGNIIGILTNICLFLKLL